MTEMNKVNAEFSSYAGYTLLGNSPQSFSLKNVKKGTLFPALALPSWGAAIGLG